MLSSIDENRMWPDSINPASKGMKHVMRKITICLWLLSCAALGIAHDVSQKSASQGRPDLSGTWVLDRKKADLTRFDRDLRRGGITMIVQHLEPEIKITRKFKSEGKDRTQDLVYYTDGRGEKNPGLVTKDMVTESRTLWDGNRLVSKSLSRMRTSQGILEIEGLQKWELSADGRTLTQIITHGNLRSNPGGHLPIMFAPPPEKRFFNRVP